MKSSHSNLSLTSIDTVTIELLPQITELWKRDRKTLGFFPQGAFEAYADKGNIRVAKDKSGLVIGYVAFRETKNWIRIAHLCVKRDYRGIGLAKILIDDLKIIATKRDCFGIALKCRRDFSTHKFWPKVGFTARSESEGRGSNGKSLTLFTWESGVPDLLSGIVETDEARLSVVMDTNVFIDIFGDGKQNAAEESRALDEPWLSDSISLSIVNEVFNEIDRIEDEKDRISLTLKARAVEERHYDEEKAKAYLPIVEKILNWNKLTPNRRSDIFQVSRAAASNCDVFITRDGELLEKAEEILEACELMVQRPVDLISNIDQAERTVSYSPASLAGTEITARQLHASDIEMLADTFLSTFKGEVKSQFKAKLFVEVSKVRSKENYINELIENKSGTKILFYSYCISSDTMSVGFLRSTKSRLAPTIVRSTIINLVNTAAKSNCSSIRILDNHYSAEISDALVELNFNYNGDMYFRRIGHGIIDITDLSSPDLIQLGPIPKDIIGSGNTLELAQYIEKTRWPVKTSGSELKSVLIPIKPHWAGKLFYPTVAEQELFRPSPILALNRENVFYSKSVSAPIDYQSRILWYTTSDSSVRGAGHICGCSRLIRSHRLKAKEAFKAFNRLGAYDWRDLLNKTGGDPNGMVTAYHFTDTEIFDNPVTLDEARKIGAGNMIAGPSILTESQFLEIYKRGINTH